ncbi:hypothetical protein NDU88_011910 [Pleurodeles waltl]|uniref:Uncharacterized protein n=1 Tax=Pleurodeles waltl TaxID=8319 RepID=A0AAV7S526_PLEWA|nr:hypothetical protein NDU88_011910 [Pleurodeles waltl]
MTGTPRTMSLLTPVYSFCQLCTKVSATCKLEASRHKASKNDQQRPPSEEGPSHQRDAQRTGCPAQSLRQSLEEGLESVTLTRRLNTSVNRQLEIFKSTM